MLLGREEEMSSLTSYLRACVVGGRTGSVHVSGSPGVGKTATLARVTAELIVWAQSQNHPVPFLHNMNGYTVGLSARDVCASVIAMLSDAERKAASSDRVAWIEKLPIDAESCTADIINFASGRALSSQVAAPSSHASGESSTAAALSSRKPALVAAKGGGPK